MQVASLWDLVLIVLSIIWTSFLVRRSFLVTMQRNIDTRQFFRFRKLRLQRLIAGTSLGARNIRRFGTDPYGVTLFGHGAGARAISTSGSVLAETENGSPVDPLSFVERQAEFSGVNDEDFDFVS